MMDGFVNFTIETADGLHLTGTVFSTVESIIGRYMDYILAVHRKSGHVLCRYRIERDGHPGAWVTLEVTP